jgi:hypothetical protein
MNHTVGSHVICSQSFCQNLNRALHPNMEGAGCVGAPSHKFLYSVPCSFGRLDTLFLKKVLLVVVFVKFLKIRMSFCAYFFCEPT